MNAVVSEVIAKEETLKHSSNLIYLILKGEVTKAKNIKADLQRRVKPTAGGTEKNIKKDWKI